MNILNKFGYWVIIVVLLLFIEYNEGYEGVINLKAEEKKLLCCRKRKL